MSLPIVRILQIVLIATAVFPTQVCFARDLCPDLFRETQPLRPAKPIPEVRLEDLKIVGESNLVGAIESHRVTYGFKAYDFEYISMLYGEGFRFAKFNQHETNLLARINRTEAEYLMADLEQRQNAMEDLSPFEYVQFDIAKMIVTSAHTRSMRGLKFDGREIAPYAVALVRNRSGVIIGRLTVPVPGKELSELFFARMLNAAQVTSIFAQLREQVAILERAGFVHADIALDTILVSIAKDHSVKARLVGFHSALGFGKTLAEAQAASRKTIDHLEKRLLAEVQ